MRSWVVVSWLVPSKMREVVKRAGWSCRPGPISRGPLLDQSPFPPPPDQVDWAEVERREKKSGPHHSDRAKDTVHRTLSYVNFCNSVQTALTQMRRPRTQSRLQIIFRPLSTPVKQISQSENVLEFRKREESGVAGDGRVCETPA